MPKDIIVNIDECRFRPIISGNETLKTFGVSSCICLLVRGHLLNGQNFLGMYHWSGFSTPFVSIDYDVDVGLQHILHILDTQARRELQLDEDEELFLDAMSAIGGEEQQHDEQGVLVLSGTVREVNVLKHLPSQVSEYFTKAQDCQFSNHHYLTHGDTYLDITISPSSIEWIVDESGFDTAADDEFSPDLLM